MIKELVKFTESLSEDFKAIGKQPKEGLHILLQVNDDGSLNQTSDSIQYDFFNKKMEEISPFLKKCLLLQENSWMVDTNKCLDTTTRAIHSCSSYSVGVKRDNLKGGTNYEKRKKDGKNLVYGSFEVYFEKANDILNIVDSTKIPIGNSFATFFENGNWEIILNDIINQRDAKYQLLLFKEKDLKEKLKEIKNKVEKMAINEELKNLSIDMREFQPLADSDYVIFYLDLPLEDYKKVQSKYHSIYLLGQVKDELIIKNDTSYGVNKLFLNTANADKVFQLHHTALFDFSSRISGNDLQKLYELGQVFQSNILPKPLPLFVYQNELNDKVIALYAKGKRTFREIVSNLYENHKNDFHNYYLLNWRKAKTVEILDFDFVTRFEYELNDREGLEVQNLFRLQEKGENKNKHYENIKNVFELEDRVLKYLVHDKNYRVDYFGALDREKYINRDKNPNETFISTFISFSKYRKAIYDYIYKSNRNTLKGKEFDEMIFNAISDDFKNGNEYGIKEKLNYWYSLYNYFHNNTINMASKLKEYQDFVSGLIDGNTSLEDVNDEHFAFAAGQVIYYLLKKSKSEDTSFRLMEPYLQKTNCKALQENIAEDFARYKHENFSNNFGKVAAFVLSYETNQNLKKLQPQLLSGLFSKNQLFSNKVTNENQ